MSHQGTNALRRKISGNRVGRAPIHGIEQIGENFARFLDERVRNLLRTITSAIVIDCEVRKLSTVLEDIAVPAMIGIIDVKGSQNRALVNIGMDLLFHIVDLRLGGNPAAAPMPTARSVTPIDCGLCEAFIKALIEAFEASMRLNLGPGIPSVMTLGAFEQHVTMVRIAPEHSDVLVLRISLDMGEAARSGDFELVLPLAVLDAYGAGIQPAGAAASPARADIWSRRMARAAADAPVRLTAVLHRERLPLSDLQALAPGSVLPLSRDAREKVQLILEGRSGEIFAEGRLGGFEGGKALKLTRAPDAERIDALRRALAEGEDRG